MSKGPNTAPGALTAAIAELLRGERGKRGLNNSTLAEASNVNRTAVGKILSGKKVPDIEVLESLAIALGRSLTWVAQEAEKALEGRRYDA
jgi:transcriptional regulator with XRE-family HTH domain